MNEEKPEISQGLLDQPAVYREDKYGILVSTFAIFLMGMKDDEETYIRFKSNNTLAKIQGSDYNKAFLSDKFNRKNQSYLITCKALEYSSDDSILPEIFRKN